MQQQQLNHLVEDDDDGRLLEELMPCRKNSHPNGGTNIQAEQTDGTDMDGYY